MLHLLYYNTLQDGGLSRFYGERKLGYGGTNGRSETRGNTEEGFYLTISGRKGFESCPGFGKIKSRV
jgi:hypothetical protein